MNTTRLALTLISCAAFLSVRARGEDLILKAPRPTEAGVELRVRSNGSISAAVEARLQRTQDLRTWETVGTKIKLPAGTRIDDLPLGTDSGTMGFYRLLTRPTTFTASGGAEVLGFTGLYEDAIETLGNFTVDDFRVRYGSPPPYLSALTWDPTTAAYWSQFNDPNPMGEQVWAGGTYPISLPSLALTPAELSAFRTNGFVVSARLGTTNMADIYYDIFRRDLPVLVTSDSILHAWHRSYDAILADLELQSLLPELTSLLESMLEKLPEASTEYGLGWRADRLKDADYILAVARSLLVPDGLASPNFSRLNQVTRVKATVDRIRAGSPTVTSLFPHRKAELVDFSQFIPRGHYSLYFPWAPFSLKEYFRAMKWLGVADLRVAGDRNYSSPEDLGTAVVLHDLLNRSGRRSSWQTLNQTLNTLVGPPDSMNFDVLDALMAESGVSDLGFVGSLDELATFQNRIEQGSAGQQAILGHGLFGSAGNDQIQLPRAFTFLGQRFVPDSWAFHQVTFDRIVKPGSEPPELVRRRLPYSLDIAFSVFGNDHVVPDLVANMLRTDGVPFRDGFRYQRNLAAVRESLDAVPEASWTGNIYNGWLHALRSLSEPTTGPEYPEAMRTRAWAMKTLNTQLASWTQLRHDTVLYAKQSQTPPILCSYPAGFVEPRPLFFRRMGDLAVLAESQLGELPTAAVLQDKIRPFLKRFATNSYSLQGIAEAELEQRPLDPAQTAFLENTIEQVLTYFGDRQYNGWYPLMFYRGAEGVFPRVLSDQKPPDHESVQGDMLVADVHTDYYSEPDGDPGAVLHEAVGLMHLMIIAVDNGPDRMVYGGPVFSHYEFLEPSGVRLTDEQWRARVEAGSAPPPPPWTRSFLVP